MWWSKMFHTALINNTMSWMLWSDTLKCVGLENSHRSDEWAWMQGKWKLWNLLCVFLFLPNMWWEEILTMLHPSLVWCSVFYISSKTYEIIYIQQVFFWMNGYERQRTATCGHLSIYGVSIRSLVSTASRINGLTLGSLKHRKVEGWFHGMSNLFLFLMDLGK